MEKEKRKTKRKRYQNNPEVINRYQKKALKKVLIALHKVNDSDILEALETQPNKSGYIKTCIREHLETNK